MSKRIALFPALLLALLVIVATALTWMNFSQALPRSQWAQAAWSPDIDVIEQMIFHYSLLPRLAISLLMGAGLGLVGVLFQQVLRNPLAEPTTLGVATGAQLGITVTTLWAIPGAMASQFAALAGACVVGLIVFGVAWGKRLSPVTLILAGLVVSLYCGAINQLLVIFLGKLRTDVSGGRCQIFFCVRVNKAGDQIGQTRFFCFNTIVLFQR